MKVKKAKRRVYLSGKYVFDLIGCQPDDQPYLRVGHEDGTMVAYLEGNSLRCLGNAIQKATKVRR